MARFVLWGLAVAVSGLIAGHVLPDPAHADRGPADKVCGLSWTASTGSLSVERRFAPDGSLKLEQIGVTAGVSRSSGGIQRIAFHEQRGTSVAADQAGPHYWLQFYLAQTGPRRLLFEIETPTGKLILPGDSKTGKVPLAPEQLSQILAASGSVAYKVYEKDDAARTMLREGSFDTSAFAASDLAGLAALADQGRGLLDTASASEDPPCGLDIGSYDLPRRMEITCKESWISEMGNFEMIGNRVYWGSRALPGAVLFGGFYFNGGPLADRVDFLGETDNATTMSFVLYGDDPLWRRNMDFNTSRPGKLQVSEISAGSVVLRSWLAVQPRYVLSHEEDKIVRQILRAPGALSLKIYDVETGMMRSAELADGWQGRLTAELRGGLKRLQIKERTPLSSCEAEIHDYEMEGEIVT